jgi:hypothetical protein
MSHQEYEFIPLLPVNDTGDLLDHMEGKWGQFIVDENDRIGFVNKEIVPSIVNDWIRGCENAISGHAILQRAINEHLVSGSLYDFEMYDLFCDAVEVAEGEQLIELIIQAKKAFEALKDPTLLPELTQAEVTAAERLVAGLDPIYDVRGLAAPAEK